MAGESPGGRLPVPTCVGEAEAMQVDRASTLGVHADDVDSKEVDEKHMKPASVTSDSRESGDGDEHEMDSTNRNKQTYTEDPDTLDVVANKQTESDDTKHIQGEQLGMTSGDTSTTEQAQKYNKDVLSDEDRAKANASDTDSHPGVQTTNGDANLKQNVIHDHDAIASTLVDLCDSNLGALEESKYIKAEARHGDSRCSEAMPSSQGTSSSSTNVKPEATSLVEDSDANVRCTNTETSNKEDSQSTTTTSKGECQSSNTTTSKGECQPSNTTTSNGECQPLNTTTSKGECQPSNTTASKGECQSSNTTTSKGECNIHEQHICNQRQEHEWVAIKRLCDLPATTSRFVVEFTNRMCEMGLTEISKMIQAEVSDTPQRVPPKSDASRSSSHGDNMEIRSTTTSSHDSLKESDTNAGPAASSSKVHSIRKAQKSSDRAGGGRIVKKQTQAPGRRPDQRSSSRFHGVSWHNQRKRWRAYIYLSPGRQKYLGTFEDQVEAAVRYDEAVIRHKLRSPLNFANSRNPNAESKKSMESQSSQETTQVRRGTQEESTPSLTRTSSSRRKGKRDSSKSNGETSTSSSTSVSRSASQSDQQEANSSDTLSKVPTKRIRVSDKPNEVETADSDQQGAIDPSGNPNTQVFYPYQGREVGRVQSRGVSPALGTRVEEVEAAKQPKLSHPQQHKPPHLQQHEPPYHQQLHQLQQLNTIHQQQQQLRHQQPTMEAGHQQQYIPHHAYQYLQNSHPGFVPPTGMPGQVRGSSPEAQGTPIFGNYFPQYHAQLSHGQHPGHPAQSPYPHVLHQHPQFYPHGAHLQQAHYFQLFPPSPSNHQSVHGHTSQTNQTTPNQSYALDQARATATGTAGSSGSQEQSTQVPRSTGPSD